MIAPALVQYLVRCFLHGTLLSVWYSKTPTTLLFNSFENAHWCEPKPEFMQNLAERFGNDAVFPLWEHQGTARCRTPPIDANHAIIHATICGKGRNRDELRQSVPFGMHVRCSARRKSKRNFDILDRISNRVADVYWHHPRRGGRVDFKNS